MFTGGLVGEMVVDQHRVKLISQSKQNDPKVQPLIFTYQKNYNLVKYLVQWISFYRFPFLCVLPPD